MGKYLYKNKNKNKHSTIILCNERLYNILSNFVFCKDESDENINVLSSEKCYESSIIKF